MYPCSYPSVVCIVLYQLEKDQGFKEFLSVHQKRGQVPTWANDVVQAPGPDAEQTKSKGKKSSASDDYLNFDSDDSEEEPEDSDLEEEDEDEGRWWRTLPKADSED